MGHQKGDASVAGSRSKLIVIRDTDTLSTCEMYTLACNKWFALPPRSLAGRVLLESMRAFCFCGTHGFELNSIERVDIPKEGSWKELAISNNEIPSTFHLTGVSYHSKIIVFGGE